MDGLRFDALSKTLGRRSSRRTALGRLGGGGLGVVLAAALGGRALAQDGTPAAGALPEGLCLYPFSVAVRQGPDAGLTYDGTLALVVGPDGAVDQGSFQTTDGQQMTVVGQVTGRAVNLQFATGDGHYLFGAGTAEKAIAAGECAAGQIGGPLVGPGEGDTGDWATADLGTLTTTKRSGTCKACLQSCRRCFFGCIGDPPDAGVCRDTCIQFGDAGYGGCDPSDFGG
ncbi:MAG TPA: hypothetical protein VH482_26020 [Thermomicrobiales bacterium]|jgi:hypothetical protein